jgi:hypothetical protein
MPERTRPSRFVAYCLVCGLATDMEELHAVELIAYRRGTTYLSAVCLQCAIDIAVRRESPKSPVDEVWFRSP